MHGQIDMHTAPDIMNGLTGQLRASEALRLDLSQVTWIDSAGLASLVRLLAEARRMGSDVILERISDVVRRMIRLARLDGLFPVTA